MMNALRAQCVFLLLIGFVAVPVHAIDYHSLFNELTPTEWIHIDTMKWARNHVSMGEKMVIVVYFDNERDEVRFQIWTPCEKPDQVDTMQWTARELFGTRSDCDDTVSRVGIPLDLEDRIGELPKPIREHLNIERGLVRRRVPMPLIMHRI